MLEGMERVSKAIAAGVMAAAASTTTGAAITAFAVPERIQDTVPWWGYVALTACIGAGAFCVGFVGTYFAKANAP